MCCIDVPFINRTFQVTFGVHQDDQLYYIGIEKLNFRIPFQHFTFGDDHEFLLYGILRLRYNIVDLASLNQFLVSFEVSMCWESYKNCDWQVMILDNAVLPKGKQNTHIGYALKDYSLSSWGLNNSVDTQNLNNFKKSLLYNDLDIGWYLSLRCKGGEKMLSAETNGSVCSDNVLAEHIHCQFINTCTEIQCCIPVPILQRSFYFSLNLDVCNYNLTVYIENFVYHKMLYEYNWGTEDSFWIKGVFRIRYHTFASFQMN
ncbi:uncharacterized protein LOC134684584 [Mytilus trossulus]|uniref:uncharacterized protein LOC134684584 n=1 Tax=Mytilus trossulus TaxID=6551 RepID=UPI003003C8BB